ncbi:hypothetical protein [Leuconostoc pseudomesenteroides]
MKNKIGILLIFVSFMLIFSPLVYLPKNIFVVLTIQSYGPIFIFAIGMTLIFSNKSIKNNILPIFSLNLGYSLLSDFFSLYMQPTLNNLAKHSSNANLSVSVETPTIPGIIIMFISDFTITIAITLAFIYITNKFVMNRIE